MSTHIIPASEGLDIRQPESVQWAFLQKQEAAWQSLYAKERSGGSARAWLRKVGQVFSGQRFQMLTDQHAADLDRYLIAHRKPYRKLAEENVELLAQDKLKLKVTARRRGWLGGHATAFSGRVRPKGHSELFAHASASSLGIHDDLCFPTAFEGNIDHWGNMKMAVTSFGCGPYRTLPKSYKAVIHADGRIDANIHQTQWLGAAFGALFVDRMGGKHFSPTGKRAHTFQKNLNELHEMMAELRTELKG